jgi:hypothetical protein
LVGPDGVLRGPGVAAVWVNGREVPLPTSKRGVYALQSDYSLQQLPLTQEEITRLFSHVTRAEKRSDERLASIEAQLDPKKFTDKVLAEIEDEIDNQDLFAPDPYWEQKVDPHLKVVELPQKEEK